MGWRVHFHRLTMAIVVSLFALISEHWEKKTDDETAVIAMP